MKILFLLLIAALLIISCDKNEELKLEAFSSEAFAYDLGDSWEVNAFVNVKGFEQREVGESFSASVSYSIDLITPNGETKESVFENEEEINSEELISDLQLEAQIELDSSYNVGNYKLIFSITDNYSGREIESSVNFELSE